MQVEHNASVFTSSPPAITGDPTNVTHPAPPVTGTGTTRTGTGTEGAGAGARTCTDGGHEYALHVTPAWAVSVPMKNANAIPPRMITWISSISQSGIGLPLLIMPRVYQSDITLSTPSIHETSSAAVMAGNQDRSAGAGTMRLVQTGRCADDAERLTVALLQFPKLRVLARVERWLRVLLVHHRSHHRQEAGRGRVRGERPREDRSLLDLHCSYKYP